MSNHKDLIRKMLLPNRNGSHSLSTAMAARSGSGKTTLLTHLVNEARKDEAFKETRFVYISIKQEQLFDEKVPIVTNVDDLLKQWAKNPIVTYYPIEPEFYEVEKEVSMISSISTS